MSKLQGAVLPSSERGGIRIEYARTKMGDVVSTVPTEYESYSYSYGTVLVIWYRTQSKEHAWEWRVVSMAPKILCPALYVKGKN